MKFFKKDLYFNTFLNKKQSHEFTRIKTKNPAELISEAEKLGIENPSTLRKQEILFAILKKLAEKNEQITATGVLEVLQDGFGFLRAIDQIIFQAQTIFMLAQVKSGVLV